MAIEQEDDSLWHTKYRPNNLDELIGHENAVTRLKGMASKNKFASAMLFLGPPSVGKTTLARAIAGSVNGKPAHLQGGDYIEVNGSDKKTIEDARELVRLSKFKPMSKKRIIVIDEFQSVLSNKQASDVFLKPLEDSGNTNTIWILASMEPDKFKTGTSGPAIAKRCMQFVLHPHTNTELLAQAKRIVNGEKLGYLKDMELLKSIVKRSDNEMRTLASLIQSCATYYDGLEKKPKLFTADLLSEVIEATNDPDDKFLVDVMVGALMGQYARAQKAILNVKDHFGFIKKMLWAAQFLLNNTVLEGARHPKVWWTPANKELVAQLKGASIKLGTYAALNETCVEIAQQAQNFSVGADALISAKIYRFIKNNLSKGN